MSFDTPGSQINRELSAVVLFDAKTNNVTVLLRSAGNSLVAEGKLCEYCSLGERWIRSTNTRLTRTGFSGTYKSTENETFVDIGFDINGTKHLDASLGYAIKKFHYGYTFSPQMHLIVNNERIAALSGLAALLVHLCRVFDSTVSNDHPLSSSVFVLQAPSGMHGRTTCLSAT